MGPRSINLTFHGIGEPERSLDPGEPDVWLGTDAFRSVLDAVAERGDVRITFDDGNSSDVKHALPELRRRGLSATFFVVAGRLGTPGFLDEDDIRALAEAGMAIGCHGMRHRTWRRLDDRALHEELLDARRMLEEVVERPIREAACPFGHYDRRVLRSLGRCGYRRVFTSDRGTARSDAWLQARNTVRPVDGPRLVEDVLARERSRLGAVRRRTKLAVKRWR